MTKAAFRAYMKRVGRAPGGVSAAALRVGYTRQYLHNVLKGGVKKPSKRYQREMGRIGGLIGGPRRAAKLGPDRCREIARIAANARWGLPTPSPKGPEGL